jgi:hypothetical protein
MKPESNGEMPKPARLEFGPQPLDEFLEKRGISNHDLVMSSSEQLTHKVVAKARKGRRLTMKAQDKVARAVGAWIRMKEGKDAAIPTRGDLFNYKA